MSDDAKVLGNIIAGKEQAVEGLTLLPVTDPANEEILAYVPLSTAAEVEAAVQAAVVAHSTWAAYTYKHRAAIMFRFHQLLENEAESIAALIVRENGKNLTEALAEVAKANETVEWACSLPQLAPGKLSEVSRGVFCQESRASLGVVAAIVPFNFPAMVPMWTIPIALAMGNCVILKPSEKVPMTMQRIWELFVQAGLPPAALQLVHGGVEAVNALCDHPRIAAVSFVGSSHVAKLVAQRCHATCKRVLALGGAKNHLVALPDCDVASAARDIVASYAGCCGQRCMAASVLVVVDPDFTDVNGDSFASHLLRSVVDLAKALQPGQGPGQLGPLIDETARIRVKEYLKDAETAGASVLLDGRGWVESHGKGHWMGPSIVLHRNRADKALHDEVFGPLLSVLVVSTMDDAIAIENSSDYGNAACVYTESGALANWFTSRFRAAMMGVNIGIPVPREPFSFGGLYGSRSKFGDHDITGDGAMEFFSQRIKVTTRWAGADAHQPTAKKARREEDAANFNGRM